MTKKQFIFLFLLFLFLGFSLNSTAQSLTEGMIPKNENINPLPQDLKQLQKTVWKNFEIKLLVSPSRPYLRGPVDFFISAKKEIMMTPFAGAITVAFENISQKNASFEETAITPEDYEEDGLAKLTHVFVSPGDYAVTVAFTDPTGDLFVMRGNISIPPENFWKSPLHMILIISGAFLLGITFYLYRKNKRGTFPQ